MLEVPVRNGEWLRRRAAALKPTTPAAHVHEPLTSEAVETPLPVNLSRMKRERGADVAKPSRSDGAPGGEMQKGRRPVRKDVLAARGPKPLATSVDCCSGCCSGLGFGLFPYLMGTPGRAKLGKLRPRTW